LPCEFGEVAGGAPIMQEERTAALHVEAAGDPAAELSRLVRAWRRRLDPNSIAGLVRGPRTQNYVTQADMAQLTMTSTVWYGKFERGLQAKYSDDFLERVASALRLSRDERRTLYLLAVGHEPAPSGESVSQFKPSDSLVKLVHAQGWPCYISDQAWDVVAYNEHMLNWFPWVGAGYENNIMRWVFLHPEAMVQLYNWETDWAPLMLAQMFHANAQRRDNMRLGSLIQEILARNDFARNLWENQPKVYVHPDGDRRKLHLPYLQGVVDIEIVALEPMRAAGVRVMNLVPLGEVTIRPQPTSSRDESAAVRSRRLRRSGGSTNPSSR
jgi:transcriptional regulator with XRE-family HTH domain